MSFEACAALVEKADPERFRAIMAAPVGARRILFPLYAFNVEIIRAPWLTKEPMIAEMRLQWWRDALEEIKAGGRVRKHEVVDALAEVLDAAGAEALDATIAARRWDIYSDPFADQADFDGYIQATSGAPMITAARLLGNAAQTVVADFAYASGVANLLRALPVLLDRQRQPLPDASADGIASLAQRALLRLDAARAARRDLPQQASAPLLLGHAARPVLQNAAKDPDAALQARLELTPLRQSLRLAHVALRGWWV
ncbi:squalene/phytoene synthase family protein [Yoonia vestfoldensis]|uniref:Squalene/phytoene synthase n=1 Tax=Yoonia vestfoldensis TaxID=245188 RepID=A0A1Y0EAE5_9RHOB|nr:squalene/phytoene synthase family protein [Yoonia vestfoldensis]ARU00597.1 squalene/phytoene synthase [Yoonia vestfoldensis]